MTEGGRGLVFISHKIHEVLDISDRITVLRAGRNVGTIQSSEASGPAWLNSWSVVLWPREPAFEGHRR